MEAREELQQLTRKFMRTEVAPHIDQDERDRVFRRQWIQGLGALGLTGVAVPEEFGGLGLGSLAFTYVVEEIAQVSASYAISVSVTNLAQSILGKFGTEEQKEKWIPPLAAGDWIGAFSLSEAQSGSDAASLKASAKRYGSEYVLNGTKMWVTQADSADILLVMARTGEGSRGISTFAVEKNTPGLVMARQEKKMGLHSSHTMEILFQDCKIPAENLIAGEGMGIKIALTALDSGRVNIAATANGIAKAALKVACDHAKIRKQFGQRIGDFQGVGFMLADAFTQIEASSLLLRNAAERKDAGLDYTVQASTAKLYATDTAMKVTTDAVQVLGGGGYTEDFPVERYMRECKVLQILEGTNQIQRMVISRSLLKEDGSTGELPWN